MDFDELITRLEAATFDDRGYECAEETRDYTHAALAYLRGYRRVLERIAGKTENADARRALGWSDDV